MIVLLVFIFVILIYLSVKCIIRRVNKIKVPPGPIGIPGIGFLIHFVIGGRDYAKKLVQIKEKYGPIASVKMGSINCIWLNDYKLVREAWANPIFCGRPQIPGTTSRMHGFTGGIIFNEGEDFTEQRRFVFKTLRNLGLGRSSMESLILEECKILLKTLEISSTAISTRHLFNIASINALWRITTGERIEHDDKRLTRLAETLNRNMELNNGAKAAFFMPWLANIFPVLSGWNSYLKDANEIFDFWRDYARSRILKFEPSSHYSNFIDLYIQMIRDCKDESSSFYGFKGELSLAATLQDLFIAGIETTATTMSWACLFLAVFQEAQNKMFLEIGEVIGVSEFPSLEDRARMPFTEATVHEILRFGTLAPLGFIHRTTQDIQFHGYSIPENTIVQANFCAIHGDKEYWKDPENFRPERFLSVSSSGESKIIRHEAFLPFSCGKRVCLGQSLANDELFLFLTSIIQNFRIETDPEKPNPSLDPKIGVSAIPEDHKLLFIPRRDSQLV